MSTNCLMHIYPLKIQREQYRIPHVACWHLLMQPTTQTQYWSKNFYAISAPCNPTHVIWYSMSNQSHDVSEGCIKAFSRTSQWGSSRTGELCICSSWTYAQQLLGSRWTESLLASVQPEPVLNCFCSKWNESPCRFACKGNSIASKLEKMLIQIFIFYSNINSSHM